MKKIYFIITLLMAFAMHTNAQHWTPATGYDENMEVTGIIEIDGVEQTSTMLELGAFCGDECRGDGILVYEGLFNRYFLYLTIGGNDGDTITFRLYDNALGEELDLICSNVEIFEADKILGQPQSPYVFDFVSTIVSHTITAISDPIQGGSIEGAGNFGHGSTCTLTATANEGYTFVNWTENNVEVSDEAVYSFMVTGDRTLVANFTDETVYHTITVAASPSVGGTVTGGGEYELGSQCTVTATANEGYAFTNWTDNGTQVSALESYTFTVAHDRDLVAYFEELSDDYHWYVNTHLYNATMNITAIIQIDGVEQTRNTLELGAFCGTEVRGRERLVYDAAFNRYFLFLTIYGDNGDALTFRLYDHEAGEELDLLNYNDMVFGAGSAIGSANAPYVFNFLNAVTTHTITAIANPVEGGTVEGAGSYDYGTFCTLVATANEGYTFSNWTVGDEIVSFESTFTFMVTGDSTLVANFTDTPVNYTVTVAANPTEGGNVIGGGEYLQGTTVTVTATPNTGYAFVSWTEDGDVVSSEPEFTFTLNHDRNLVANFVEQGDYHWYVNTYTYSNTMTVTAVIQIDGVEQTRNTLELGVFCGTEVRGRERLDYNSSFNRYFLYLTVYGNNGDALTFRLYDHEVGEELDLLNFNNMTFMTGNVIGGIDNPYIFNFLTTVTTHTITATANPAEGGTVAGGGEFDYGVECTLTATPNEGFAFVNWTENDEIVTNEAEYTFMVTGDRTLVANFTDTQVDYTVTVAANPAEGGTVTGGGTFSQGTAVTVTATANDGYAFMYWTENGVQVSTSAEYTFTLNGDRELTANFEAVSGDYHWYVNTHQYANNMTATAIIEIDGVEQPLSTLELGAFCGDECRGRERPAYQPQFDRYLLYLTMYGNDGDPFTFRLYNHVTQQEMTALINFNTIVFATGAVYGDPITPYVFDFRNGITQHSIMATANPVAGGTIEGTGTYDYGTTCTLTATPNLGFAFEEWTENGEIVSTDAIYSFMVTGDRTLVANFTDTPVDYTVTVAANPIEGGTVSGGGIFVQGTAVTVTATPNEGYIFSNWMENNLVVSTDAAYTFTLTGDRNLVANFTEVSSEYHWYVDPNQFANNMTVCGIILIDGVEQEVTTLELGAFCNNECRGREMPVFEPLVGRYLLYLTLYGNDGDVMDFRLYDHVTGQELDYTCFDQLTFLNNSDIGYLLDPYSFNFVSVITTHTITVTANPVEGGTVSGGGEFDYGTECTVTATPNEGFAFTDWEVNGETVSLDLSYTFMVTGDRNLVANFTDSPVNYTITVTANPAEGGIVSGGGEYLQGDECTVTATPAAGYLFVNWTVNGSQVSTDAEYTFIVTGNRNLEAHFVEIPQGYHWYVNPQLYANNIGVTGIIQIDSVVQNSLYLEVGAFCGNECRGREKPMELFNPLVGHNVYLVFLQVYGDPGDQITFRLYDHIFGEEPDLICTNSMVFTVGGDTGDIINPYLFNFLSVSPFEITAMANPVEGGTVSGAGTYDMGSTCTLMATANPGYTFANWTTEDGIVVTENPELSFTVTEDASYTANFTQSIYEITAVAVPALAGEITGTGEYLYGETCTLTVIPSVFYEFIHWEKDGVEVATETSFSFFVTENAHYEATFDLKAVTQTTQLNSGWNWYSSYIEMDDINGKDSLEMQLGNHGLMIKSQNSGYDSYLDGWGWYGSLDSIHNEHMYMVKASEPCEIGINGLVANIDDHPITLSYGLSWIGYPVTYNLSLADAFAGFTPTSGDILKSQGYGYSSYLEGWGWYGSLGTLMPGMGVMYKSMSDEVITFTYPDTPTRRGDLKPNISAEHNHFVPNLYAYPFNMTVTAIVELDDEELHGGNYELAAFANGECRGSAKLIYVEPLDRHIAFLCVAGEEATELHFGLYDVASGLECFDTNVALTYANDANIGSLEQPFVVSFRGSASLNEFGMAWQVYPNPVEHGQRLNLDLTTDEVGEVRIEIVNALGAVVETVSSPSQLTTFRAPETAGVYTLRIVAEGKGTCHRKLIVR